NLTLIVQELITQLAQVKDELGSLKERANTLPQPITPEKAGGKSHKVSTTRRNTLKRLGLALLGGAATATALGEAPTAQAKVVANPQGVLANRVGMLVVPPGSAAPTGNLPDSNSIYGLIASGDKTSVDLAKIKYSGNTGVYG